ncbi:MAG: excinuclease ABC subunit UvrB [Candidatus Merdousia sp.]|nr:excinuclease ABC subunit UvrB [Candidatus Merdousia sp.]
MGTLFKLASKYAPSGDQPKAIDALCKSIESGSKYSTLVGVTGSGKTFTMANVIAKMNRPALIISHNKTLSAQLYSEFKEFFPENAVEYFVSYYDYYQPEAYIPQTDTYIEKDSSINDDIEKLRISTASSLVSRRDVIVVATVSCIYGLGSPEDFRKMMVPLRKGLEISRESLAERMIDIRYSRNDTSFERGVFRVRGDVIDIYPAYLDTALRVEFFGDEIDSLKKIDPLTGENLGRLDRFDLYPATGFVTPKDAVEAAAVSIRAELEERVAQLERENKLLEAQRIKMRTEQDLDLLAETGFCTGIENYSRHLAGRPAGSRPWCLLDFFPKDTLLFLDESHVTYPQIRGMFHGDRSRKERLIEYGFRLPSALDNRPLRPEEFDSLTGQTIFVSATPAPFELSVSDTVVEQINRPTGLLDPEMIVRPIKGQVEDCTAEIKAAAERGERVFVTTLTKRMSEEITDYLRENGVKVEYLHSDIDAIERVEILRRLRLGESDALVGVNLLREGIDVPEVSLVCILDADKEGFLRSATSLIQTAGRAARHVDGRVILYADNITGSLKTALDTCRRRREEQMRHNAEFGITPQSVSRPIQQPLVKKENKFANVGKKSKSEVARLIDELQQEMLSCADRLDFERAAVLRDQIKFIRENCAK